MNGKERARNGEIEVNEQQVEYNSRPELKQHGEQKKREQANDERKIMIKNL